MKYFFLFFFSMTLAHGETVKVFLDNANDISEFKLQSSDEISTLVLKNLTQILKRGSKENNFFLVFKNSETTFPRSAIFHHYGYLTSVFAITKNKSHQCTREVLSYPWKDTAFGGDEFSMIEGICGEIASLHSALKLKLIKKEDTLIGDHFNPEAIKKMSAFKKQSPSGMTMREIARAHSSVGAKECYQGGPEDTSKKERLALFTEALHKKVSEKANPFDCSYGVTSRNKDGKLLLSHVEHITGMDYDKASGSANIQTINGLNQGNRKTTVPASPGSNSWYLTPGGAPPAGLDMGATEKIDELLSLIVVTEVEYLCCRKKAP